MEFIARYAAALIGPKIANWLAGLAVAAGGLLALLAARHRGKALGRAEMRAQNARAAARKQAELNAIRADQMKAANNRPDTSELDEILKKGEF